jgi:peptidoglycan-N-acetylglucosamine deacetylase
VPPARPLHLTFDDGPDPRWTPRVVEALDACGARATFFVVAPLAAAHPEVVRAVVAAGHRVELHCEEHVRQTSMDEGAAAAALQRALATLRELGVEPTLWRTPWGDRAAFTRGLAERFGLTLVDWTADSHDWRGDRADAMLAALRPRLKPGAVVLAHDGLGPGARRDGCDETVALVELIGALAAEHGWALEPLGAGAVRELVA